MLTKAAGDQLSKWVPGAGVIDVEVIFDASVKLANGGSILGSATYVGTVFGFSLYETVFAYELRTGVDVNGASPDATLRLNPDAVRHFLDPSPDTDDDVPANSVDVLTVLKHELVHALAFSGTRGNEGQLSTLRVSPFDGKIIVKDGQVYFAGTASVAEYGALVPLTTGNIYHYGTAPTPSTQLLGGIMNAVLPAGQRLDLNSLDLDILQDSRITVSKANDTYAYTWGSNDSDLLSARVPTIFMPLGGNDTIAGSTGVDIVTYSGARASYTVSRTSYGLGLKSAAGKVDQLTSVERLQFDDFSVAYDTQGSAGQAYRLYQAAFDRSPDFEGLEYQMNALDAGWRLTQVAQNFIDSPEFRTRYSTLSDNQFVTQLYANVLHRQPDVSGLSYHLNNLTSGYSRADTLVGFSESPENQAAVVATISSGMIYKATATQPMQLSEIADKGEQTIVTTSGSEPSTALLVGSTSNIGDYHLL